MNDTIRLGEIAHARSGDKGNHANIGVIAYTSVGYEFLEHVLTSDRVAAYFAPLGVTRVDRFALPGIHAYNFLLYDALGGGASRSLRTDTQGKTLGPALRELRIPAPPDLSACRPPDTVSSG